MISLAMPGLIHLWAVGSVGGGVGFRDIFDDMFGDIFGRGGGSVSIAAWISYELELTWKKRVTEQKLEFQY